LTLIKTIASYLVHRQKLSGHGKVVLISGCDSGFGFKLTEDLSQKEGCTVLAGCFTEGGLKHWERQKNVIAFSLDITDENSRENAYKIVSLHGSTGLWAIVNNAGNARGTLFELTPVSEYKKLMDINFFGHVALSQKLLPFIKLVNGRIINMASVAGVFAAPNLSVYCTTKFAMYAWSHCIRRELLPYGISVSVILPGWMKTNLVSEESFRTIDAENFSLLTKEKQEEFKNYFEGRKKAAKIALDSAENPQQVVDAYVHAILGKYPQSTYIVGKSGYSTYRISRYLPEFIVDKLMTVKDLPVSKALNH